MTDPVWEEFRRTCVRLDVPGGFLDIEPIAGDDPGDYLDGVAGPVHVLTAQNPMGIAAAPEANDAANRLLAAELARHDLVGTWPATGYGGGPIEDADTWQESGFAVAGLTRSEALDLAIRFAQRAIFEWRDEPGGFRLVACDGSADEPRGWTATFVPHHPDPAREGPGQA